MSKIPYARTSVPVGGVEHQWKKKLKSFSKDVRYYASRLSKGKMPPYTRTSYIQHERWLYSNPQIAKLAEQTLLSEASLDRGFVKREGIKKIFVDHRKGKWVALNIIHLFFLECWLRKNIDSEDLSCFST